jgi:hypothetical protein
MLRDLSKYGVEADVVRMAQHPRHQLVRIAGGQSAAFMVGLHASPTIAAGVLLAAVITILWARRRTRPGSLDRIRETELAATYGDSEAVPGIYS